jgi:glycosyltransferase involved in cell wall biosynthesis
MKTLNVFFNPGVHPQFREILDFPPKGVKYHYSQSKEDYNSDLTRKKRAMIIKFHNLGIPRMTFVRDAKKYDIIHSTRGILPLNRKPWIVDIESGAAFSGLNWKNLRKPLMQKIIIKMLSSPYCKKIIPQSEAATRSLLENVDCSSFKDKIETVYLAYRATKLKRKKSNKVRLSFIGRTFYEKGGHHLLEAFKILDKKYPGKIILKYKGKVPENKKLRLPNIEYLENIPDPKKFYDAIFGDCDIYVQPTTVDSFGVSILEAMSTGLPIVCTDDFTLPELVNDGYNGFLVKSPSHWYDHRFHLEKYPKISSKKNPQIVKELVEKISILIEDKKLREKMGRNSFKIVSSGKFSIKQRNKHLLKIYKEALEE